MNSPRSVQAVFVKTAYPLTATIPGGGSVSVNGQVLTGPTFFPIGSLVPLTAVASNGWSFLGWGGDASGTNNPLYLTMNQTNNVQARFGTALGENGVGGGSVVFNPPNPIPFGATVMATAVPYSGNYFVIWSGATSGTNSPTMITVTTATPTVNALFAALPSGKYTVTAVINWSGMVTISPRQNYYNLGDTVTLRATTTDPGTVFYRWTQGATGTTNPLTMVVTANTVIQANFVRLVIVSPTMLSGGQFQFSFDTATGVNYDVQYSTSLTKLFPFVSVIGNGVPMTLIDTTAAGSQNRFYRLSLGP
jgi:hypothetical protein